MGVNMRDASDNEESHDCHNQLRTLPKRFLGGLGGERYQDKHLESQEESVNG